MSPVALYNGTRYSLQCRLRLSERNCPFLFFKRTMKFYGAVSQKSHIIWLKEWVILQKPFLQTRTESITIYMNLYFYSLNLSTFSILNNFYIMFNIKNTTENVNFILLNFIINKPFTNSTLVLIYTLIIMIKIIVTSFY